MAYADKNDVSEIVFPPLERIAAQRFTPGTEGYEKAIKPGSGFYNTYVTSLGKVLDEIKRELGDNAVQVAKRPINYGPTEDKILTFEDLSKFDPDRAALPREGISIRIPTQQEIDFSRPRFNKGGLVTRTRQAFGEIE